jgi:hypothetical protein
MWPRRTSRRARRAQRSPVPEEAFANHVGRWVAVKDGKVVADAANAKELLDRPEVDSDATPFYVPDTEELF